MYAEEAEKLAMLWVHGLDPQPPLTLPEDRVIQLKDSQLLCFPGLNPENSNSVLQVIFQMGDLSLQERAHLAFIQHVMKEPAFHQLRTEEQLGYIVHTSPHTSGASIKGLQLLIQSDMYDPIYLESRVQVFLQAFRSKVLVVPERDEAVLGSYMHDFQRNIKAVVKALLDKPKNLLQESTILWDTIGKRQYKFHARKEIAKFVEALTPTSVLEFFDRHIVVPKDPDEDDSKYATNKKLSVHVFGSNHLEALMDVKNRAEILTLESAAAWKRSMELFPAAPSAELHNQR